MSIDKREKDCISCCVIKHCDVSTWANSQFILRVKTQVYESWERAFLLPCLRSLDASRFLRCRYSSRESAVAIEVTVPLEIKIY